MEVEVRFTDQPIVAVVRPYSGESGAVLEFGGVVRGVEHGGEISALVYEIYPAMAEKVIRKIVHDLAVSHPCNYVGVIHREGIVPVGEASIFVRVESKHRAEAIAMVEGFMHRMKKDAPIWKVKSLPC